jgi:hypothetical protein
MGCEFRACEQILIDRDGLGKSVQTLKSRCSLFQYTDMGRMSGEGGVGEREGFGCVAVSIAGRAIEQQHPAQLHCHIKPDGLRGGGTPEFC